MIKNSTFVSKLFQPVAMLAKRVVTAIDPYTIEDAAIYSKIIAEMLNEGSDVTAKVGVNNIKVVIIQGTDVDAITPDLTRSEDMFPIAPNRIVYKVSRLNDSYSRTEGRLGEKTTKGTYDAENPTSMKDPYLVQILSSFKKFITPAKPSLG